MSEKPILFSGPMVRAILSGRKTQTRRVVKPQPSDGYHIRQEPNGKWYAYSDETLQFIINARTEKCKWRSTNPYKPKYQPGDVLWVRETWACVEGTSDFYAYKADGPEVEHIIDKWKPAIHMPRAAARLFLKVVNVRCERLWDITAEDAISEGMLSYDGWKTPEYEAAVKTASENGTRPPLGFSPNKRFAHLWDSLNAKRGYGWDKDPWVWVIEFERIEP